MLHRGASSEEGKQAMNILKSRTVRVPVDGVKHHQPHAEAETTSLFLCTSRVRCWRTRVEVMYTTKRFTSWKCAQFNPGAVSISARFYCLPSLLFSTATKLPWFSTTPTYTKKYFQPSPGSNLSPSLLGVLIWFCQHMERQVLPLTTTCTPCCTTYQAIRKCVSLSVQTLCW